MAKKPAKSIFKLKGEGEISRREFLKDVGLVVGGAGIASLSLASACQTPATTTPATSPTTSKITTSKTTQTSTTTTSTTNGTSTSTQPSSSTNPGTSTSTHLWTPPVENPELIDIEGCTSKVAADRVYSIDHTWMLPIGDDRVVLGITDKMQLLLGLIELGKAFYLQPVGTVIKQGDFLANIEGYKMNVDLLSPISGTILDENDALYTDPGLLGSEPYLGGWMFVIKLSKPEEMNEMITPQEYALLQVPT